MSHLDVPRIYFAGRFMARPPTGNNNLPNYDPAVVLQTAVAGASGDAEWHPRGTGEFRFISCAITGITDETYQTLAANTVPGQPATTHPLLGVPIETAAVDSSPKMVDLDPEQQNCPEIFGLRVTIMDIYGNPMLCGLIDPPPTARDIWSRIHGEPGDWGRSGVFQSVLTKIVTQGAVPAPLPEMLRRGNNRLSVKFVTDDFGAGVEDANRTYLITDPNFATGRLVGIIGPAGDDEPAGYVAARRLLPTADKTVTCAPAPFTINQPSRKLTIDMSNSIQWQQTPQWHAGEAVQGTFFAAYRDPSKQIVHIGGALTYSKAAYESTACIFDRDVTDAQIAVLRNRPLIIALAGQAVEVAALAEHADGICVESEPLVARLNAGETATVEVRARKFGVSLPGYKVSWGFERANAWNNTPAGGVSFDKEIVTGANGRATFHLTAKPLGNLPAERKHIDSQVYFLGGPWDNTHRGNAPGAMGSTASLSVLVFNAGDVIADPRWQHVQPVMQQYMRLYPGMRAILELATLSVVREHKDKMIEVLSHQITEPNYMPVTRDLPEFRRQTLLNWLKNGCPE